MGIRHTIPSPGDQAASLRRLAGAEDGRRGLTIAITSGKGGVGKTNIAVNLAVCLASAGRRVTLVDLDTGLANADVLLNVQPRYNLADVVCGRRTVPEITFDAPGGIQFVPGASGDAALADMSPLQRSELVRQLRSLGDTSDFVVYDCGAGISQTVLAFARMADVVTVVSTSEPTSLTDAYAIIKLLVRRKYHGSIRLLLNMVQGRVEARRTFARVAEVAEKFLDFRLADGGYVLQDNHVELAVRGRTPMVLSYPRCPSSLCMTAFAARLLQAGAARVPARDGGLVARFVGLFA